MHGLKASVPKLYYRLCKCVGLQTLVRYSSPVFKLLESCQEHFSTALLELSAQKHLVEGTVDLVEIENNVELANAAEERIKGLDEKVNCLEVKQLVIRRLYTNAEKEARIPSVNDLSLPKLDEIGLELLISTGY